MAAQCTNVCLLDGLVVKTRILNAVSDQIVDLLKLHNGLVIKLGVIQLGMRHICLRSIGDSAGVTIVFSSFPSHGFKAEILMHIEMWNDDDSIHGIIVEYLVNEVDGIDIIDIENAICPQKDVSGYTKPNIGRYLCGNPSSFVPCLPLFVLELLKQSGVPLQGRTALIAHGSCLQSASCISQILRQTGMVTMVIHYMNDMFVPYLKNADIVITAIGVPCHVLPHNLKTGCVVIDCGCTECVDHNTEVSVLGDVANLEAREVVSCISASPDHLKYLNQVLALKNVIDTVKKYLCSERRSMWNIGCTQLKYVEPIPSDLEISLMHDPKDITLLAKEIGLLPPEIDLYGKKKAKVSLSVLDRLKYQQNGAYVVITGITPTPLGEGKSTTTYGICQSLVSQLNTNAIACVRQPSQGPTFGIKGGAAGGGYSQVIPMDEFNLHLTGDIHAITAANNLLAAQLDARIFHESTAKSDMDLYKKLVPTKNGRKEFSKIQLKRLKKLNICPTDPDQLTEDEVARFVRLNIDPETITFNRVIDTNDRFLRKITIGQNPSEKGMTRKTQFDITVASELMSILALSNGMEDMHDKLSKIVVANDRCGNPVTSEDLGVSGALCVLMKDTIRPTLMQTLEGTPVFIHAGPFANISHGNSSIIADKIALKLVGREGVVVTEAGFGSDIGFEKFCNIKCRYSGLKPNVAVIVTTVRALKMHGGGSNVVPGATLPSEYTHENLDLISRGFCNLGRHLEHTRKYRFPVIVAINRFVTDTDAEIKLISSLSHMSGVFDVVECTHFAEGGKGAVQLGKAVIRACQVAETQFIPLYHLSLSIEDKMKFLAQMVYGAADIEISSQARKMIDRYTLQGYDNLPICMCKTHLSFSHNPSEKGAPSGFLLPISDLRGCIGAGFLYPVVGNMPTIPGLPIRPSIYDIDLNVVTGKVEGLF